MKIHTLRGFQLRRAGFRLLLSIALMATFVVSATSILANPGNEFEIDGNTAQDSPPLDDWETVIPGPGSLGVSAVLIQDPHSKAETDPNIFSPAGKFGDPANWNIKAGSVGPAQNELTNVYAYALTPQQTGDDAWIVMGMHRTKSQGTFDLDFELNQVPWTDTSTGPVRTAGDVAVGFELSGNPTDPQADLFILVLRYDPTSLGNNTANGDPYVREYGAGWWVVFEDFADVSQPGVVEATMNAVSFPAPPWGALDASGDPVDTVDPFFFAEAAINLSALGINPGCPGFQTVHAKSRSSLEITSDLKDLAGPVSLPIDCAIFGHKYEDQDADGDISEDTGSPLQGWTINLYLDDGDNVFDGGDSLVATTMTDADGYYEFGGLTDGVYHVEEVLQAGWNQSYPPPPGIYENIPVDIFNTIVGPLDFGNWQPGTKSGHKYEDQDADGDVSDDTGSPLSGWTIYVDYDDDGVLDLDEPSAVTAADGSYTISGIVPGTWKVREVLQAGWTNSYPATSDAYGKYHEETFTSGDSFEGNDFGNWQPASKSGHKYEDMDADGDVSDDTGNPLAGWTIYVDYDDDGEPDLDEPSAVTAADGSYTISGIVPGTWKVRELLQPGWTNSYPLTSDVYGKYHEETFTSGDSLEGNDFGNWQPGTKSGYKYNDLDADGDIAEDTGNPLAGWEIRAYADDGDGILEQAEYDAGPAANAFTDAFGAYSLTLDPGDYVAVEVLQDNWLQSVPAGPSVLDAGLNTGAETLGDNGYAFTMTSRGVHSDNNFGNYQAADLEVAKTGMISYTITVTNNGPSAAINVVVDDELPGNLAWSIQSSPAGFSIVGNHLQGTVPSLASGDSIVITVEAPIPQGNYDDALLPNTATASSDIPDLDESNNSADADIGPLP